VDFLPNTARGSADVFVHFQEINPRRLGDQNGRETEVTGWEQKREEGDSPTPWRILANIFAMDRPPASRPGTPRATDLARSVARAAVCEGRNTVTDGYSGDTQKHLNQKVT